MSGSGNAVVLLHGQPGSADDWAAVAADLACDHRVIVPDRLGYGRTGGSPGGFSANAVAIVKLMDQLGEMTAVVVGHSWAGGTALAMALDFPSRISGLGLVSSVAPGEPLSRVDRVLALPVLGSALGALALSAGGRLLTASPTRALAGMRPGGRIEALAGLITSWRQPSTWASFLHEQRALVVELPLLGPRLSQLNVPTLVMAGAVDRIVSVHAGERLAATIPSALLEVVPNAGHLLPQFEPRVVAAALRRLVSRTAA